MIGLILLVISLAIAGIGLYRAEKTLFTRGEASADASASQLAAAADAFPVEVSPSIPEVTSHSAPDRAPVKVAGHAFNSERAAGELEAAVTSLGGDGAATAPANDQILVVDLDQKVRSRLREILGETYSVVEAEDAARAVSMMSRRQPALAVVGSNVKDRHGRPFWEWMRRSDTLGSVPVLLVTALTAHEDIADRFDHLPYQPSAVLRKPLLIEEVGRTVARLIEGREDPWGGDGAWGALSNGNDEDVRFVRRAQEDVEANIANPNFGVRELSAEMGLSARQLQRRLRETTGQSPNSFIRSIRLQQAARQLEQGSEPVSQVAYAVGFNSLSYFAKCFREHFGRNPSEFTARRHRAGAAV
ncbi:MAG: AraC-like DNA-binding protein [Rhodothermales bacterium]|jgi:AraC-like DNA-binding protein